MKETQEDKKSGICRTTTYTYDKAGNQITKRDRRGTIHYQYDFCNQKVREEDREGGIQRWSYDKDGNVIRWIDADQYERKEEEATGTTFTYDVFGRFVKTYDASGYLQEWNHYNQTGQLIRKETGIGLLAKYGYDLGGRPITITTAEAKRVGRVRQKYQYDAQGNITGIKDGEGNETHYQLDGWGRIRMILYPDGSKEQFTYSDMGNLTTTTDGKGGTITYRYRGQNQVAEVLDQVGEKEFYTYDREGRMVSHLDRNGTQIRYVWGMDGNLLEKYVVQTEGKEKETNRLVYQYDTEGQLIQASGGGVCYQYEYTPNGWLKNKYWNGRRVLSYTYTKNGLIKSVTDPNGKRTEYEYDDQNRLVFLKEKGKRLVEYVYHPDHTRKKIRFANGVVTKYRYDLDRNLTRLVTIGKEGNVFLSYEYTYDGNGNRVGKWGKTESFKEGKTTYYYDKMQRLSKVSYPDGYHTNEHGDIEGITDEKGGVCNCYQYDAFGKLMEKKWEIENRYTYSGEVYDGVTEQYYLRARNYNPQIARFTQEDVYRGDGLNLYVYCKNNAIMYFDPSGYFKAEANLFSDKHIGEEGESRDLKAAILVEMFAAEFKNVRGKDYKGSQRIGSHQAQHLIPKSFVKHTVIEVSDYQVDHYENGIFDKNFAYAGSNKLIKYLDDLDQAADKPIVVVSTIRDKFISDKTQHGIYKCKAGHDAYNDFVERKLNEIAEKHNLKLDMSKSEAKQKRTQMSAEELKQLQDDLLELNQYLRRKNQEGIDLYIKNDMNQGVKNYHLEEPMNKTDQQKYEGRNFSDEPSFACVVK